MPAPSDDTRRRPRPAGRVDYAVASRAARDVLQRANGAGLTIRQFRMLNAVIAHTALYSRLEDRGLYLAQLAAFAHGVDEALPWMCEQGRQDLAALRRAGLITSTAPRGRPNVATPPRYIVGLNVELIRTDSDADYAPENRTDQTDYPHSSEPKSALASPHKPHAPATNTALKPHDTRMAYREGLSEEIPGEIPGEISEGRAVPSSAKVRSLAQRLASLATTNEPKVWTDREAHAVVSMLVDHESIDDIERQIDIAESAGEIRYPAQLLSCIELCDDEIDMAESTVGDDRRYVALRYRARFTIADIVAHTLGTNWTDHADEATAVVDHWRDNDVHSHNIDAVIDRARADGLRRPAHADLLLRDHLEQLGLDPHDYPPFKPGPAQKPRTSR